MVIETVEYRINWRSFHPGYSFFIPCHQPNKARKIVRETTNRLGFKVDMKVVIHEGVRGLRVWRS
jgi:hypothetical protein